MRLFGIKTCDTCRKALKEINNVEFVDVRVEGLPNDVRDAALTQFGDKLLNTRSTTWRGLDESERSRPAVELLAEHPTLMKRPLIEADGQLHLGWTAETRVALGLS
ncbi:Regulatory protein Spx [Falsiruegeria litorea R37]|uniref:Regulatory protein Spx n=1 Tax=Falsiruegeria litorea R37 TaxID=1200284 RepID=A0A1Y5T7I8_9RHOB|nr:ArsC/Spx/MgsR family protein [Falsiruegeria litorea]SLN57369.1 Regulatory protein Spx [Falsiruegeria litorea R37]